MEQTARGLGAIPVSINNMKQIVSIEKMENGIIIHVGCKHFVFGTKDIQEAMKILTDYLTMTKEEFLNNHSEYAQYFNNY